MIRHLGLGAAMALCLSVTLTTDAAAQGGRGGGMGMGGRGLAALLSNEGVQKELKLDESQVTKAGELATKAREKMTEARESLQSLEGPERMQKMQALNHEINTSIKKDAAEFLKADQLARLTQIDYQNRGAAVFHDPEVVAKLKISDEQKTSIDDIIKESMTEIRTILTNAGGNREEAAAKLTELQKGTKEKVEGKLTEDQKKAWKEMLGTPFEVKFPPRQRQGN